MPTEKIFDAHFHLLFKHFITRDNAATNNIDGNFKLDGWAEVMNNVFGGLFDSQSSPKQVSESPLFLGVIGLLSIEHAFANKLLNVAGIDLGKKLPVDHKLIEETKTGKRTYYDEFNRQLKFHIDNIAKLNNAYNIHFLHRKDWVTKNLAEIEASLSNDGKRYLAISIEGGHNLSNVFIRQGVPSRNPELQLKALQDNPDIDIMSMNLCHLSYIPEQILGGFAQGLNRTAQKMFSSDDFLPKGTLGLTELGKKVIRQALTHATKPVLIDVKHMSVYSRFHYYRFKEKLEMEDSSVKRLPLFCSHTGFTFTSLDSYIKNRKYEAETPGDGSFVLRSENRKVGSTNDRINKGIYANPWTIGMFDEEIADIMSSGGLIGISMDQRVLGASKMIVDSSRPRYYEEEYVAIEEGKKLFIEGALPAAESIFERILGAPTRAERHIMLFCLHIVYAVRIGYSSLAWIEGTSPWDHLCIGSDFDGLINPINGYDDITDMKNMRGDLTKYLPFADKLLQSPDTEKVSALRYNDDGTVNKAFLDEKVEAFLFGNGVKFMARYLKNWN